MMQFIATFKKLMFRFRVALTPSDNANITVQDDTSFLVPGNLGSLNDVNDVIDSNDQLNLDFVIFEEVLSSKKS